MIDDFKIDANIAFGAQRMVIIDESCNLCRKCVEVCPFQALKISDEGDLMFKPNSCIDECEVCRLSCPKKAIDYTFIFKNCEGKCSKCSSHCKNSNKN